MYSEMVTSSAVLHGPRDRLLGFNKEEHPLAIQLAGADPAELSKAAMICEDFGYDEINLNVGCPSDRVQSGSFGACLMMEPERVADCVQAIKSVVSLPVTVKHRTGVDDHDSFPEFIDFVRLQIEAGADALIIHARKAWLQGLSPRQNRTIPPLQYDWVYRIKQLFPRTEIIINGGITSLQACQQHLLQVDGVMLGREPFANPYLLARVDSMIFQDKSRAQPAREEILQLFENYIAHQLEKGIPLSKFIRPVMGLFHAQPNARFWRRYLSENARRKGGGLEIIHQAAEKLTQEVCSSMCSQK